MDAPSSSSGSSSSAPRVAAMLLGIMGMCVVLFVSTRGGGGVMRGGTKTIMSLSTSSSDATLDASSFSFQRDGYDLLPQSFFKLDAKDNTVSYKYLHGYHAIIEPYVPMSMAYIGDTDDLDSSSHYRYSIVSSEKGGGKYVEGYFYPLKSSKSDNSFTVECTAREELVVTLTKYDSKGSVQGTVDMSVLCMYVRRELRELTDDDLDATMDAMYTMWDTTEAKGSEKYGENFHSASWFAEMHDFNAAWIDSDHIHEGLGFLPQHMKMSNLYELSMQAVDPSVTLFYWDFTIETSSVNPSIFNSPMFTEDTFGSLAAPTDSTWGWTYRDDSIKDTYIQNGRWKNTAADKEKVEFEDVGSNPFGYMRGPWNMNPSPNVVRFGGNGAGDLPSCSQYYNWLNVASQGDFLQQASYAPHAATHGNIGGVFGCDMLDTLRDANLILTDAKQMQICYKWGFYLKELYRARFLTPKTDCETNSKLSYDDTTCGFECSKSDKDDMITFLQESISIADYLDPEINDDGWEQVRDFWCTGDAWRIFVGDHLESASPKDPSFWPIHPTQDRLWQLKMMAGGFEDTTWPTTAQSAKYLCNHAQCYDYEDEDSEKGYYAGCCAGHYEDDQLFDHTTGDRTKGYGPTNREVLDDSDPTSSHYKLNYIYSHFDYDHCEDDGYAFASLVKDLASRRRR